jgi:hypothetical protein
VRLLIKGFDTIPLDLIKGARSSGIGKEMEAKYPGGHWVTERGRHVYIMKNGKVAPETAPSTKAKAEPAKAVKAKAATKTAKPEPDKAKGRLQRLAERRGEPELAPDPKAAKKTIAEKKKPGATKAPAKATSKGTTALVTTKVNIKGAKGDPFANLKPEERPTGALQGVSDLSKLKLKAYPHTYEDEVSGRRWRRYQDADGNYPELHRGTFLGVYGKAGSEVHMIKVEYCDSRDVIHLRDSKGNKVGERIEDKATRKTTDGFTCVGTLQVDGVRGVDVHAAGALAPAYGLKFDAHQLTCSKCRALARQQGLLTEADKTPKESVAEKIREQVQKAREAEAQQDAKAREAKVKADQSQFNHAHQIEEAAHKAFANLPAAVHGKFAMALEHMASRSPFFRKGASIADAADMLPEKTATALHAALGEFSRAPMKDVAAVSAAAGKALKHVTGHPELASLQTFLQDATSPKGLLARIQGAVSGVKPAKASGAHGRAMLADAAKKEKVAWKKFVLQALHDQAEDMPHVVGNSGDDEYFQPLPTKEGWQMHQEAAQHVLDTLKGARTPKDFWNSPTALHQDAVGALGPKVHSLLGNSNRRTLLEAARDVREGARTPEEALADLSMGHTSYARRKRMERIRG